MKTTQQLDTTQQNVLLWSSAWFIFNITITFYNKHVLSNIDISPNLNTFSHLSITFLGCLLAQKLTFPKLSLGELKSLYFYSLIFAGNIIYSQVGMKLTTLSLNQGIYFFFTFVYFQN